MTHLVRRDILRGLGLFTVTAALPGSLVACSKADDSTHPADQATVYPQGIASGDPKPDGIILWTRVAGGGAVHYEIAADKSFAMPVAQGDATADAASDFTVRVKVTGLMPYTTYYYRFSAQGVQSVVGRTKTAPKADQDVSPKFAFCSCQDFNGRYYHGYKALAAMAQDPKTDLDFVLHLGDYIYETEGDPRFQNPQPDRKITIAQGIDIGDASAPYKAALTLDDYRSLYKQYRADHDLQAMHALYAFINLWDDHEFADDCWQDHATAFNEAKGDEKDPARRHAASRAWFEYQPADVPFDAAAMFPSDIKVYRQVRYGKHVEIFITDQRSYRSDHLIPEGPVDPDVVKLSKNSSVGSRYFLLKNSSKDPTLGFDVKEAAAKPPPTMLGADQKDWFVKAVTGSNATWKIWANEVQLAQMTVNLKDTKVPDLYKELFYITVDQWDGYRTERKEVLGKLAGVTNLVALTGDIHSSYAAELYTDFDKPDKPVAVEYTIAGITSTSLQEIVARLIDASETFKSFGLGDLVPKMDTLLMQANPHYKFAKSKAYGFATVTVNAASEIQVTLATTKDDPTSRAFTGAVDLAKFRTKAGANKVEML